jgi:hypothetical protein
VSNQRQRVFELLAEGALHHERGLDLIPPELLARRRPAHALGILRPVALAAAIAAVAALGTALALAADWQSRRAGEATSWAMATRFATEQAWSQYLRSWPDGPHAAEAQARLAGLAAQARAELARRGAGPALLAALEAHGPSGPPLRLHVEEALRLPALDAPGLLDPRATDAAQAPWHDAALFEVRLSEALAAAAPGLRLDRTAAGAAPATCWRLRVTVGTTGDELADDPGSVRWALALDAAWVLEALQEGAPPVVLASGLVQGPEELTLPKVRWLAPPRQAAEHVYAQQVSHLAQAVAAAAVRGLMAAPGPAREARP